MARGSVPRSTARLRWDTRIYKRVHKIKSVAAANNHESIYGIVTVSQERDEMRFIIEEPETCVHWPIAYPVEEQRRMVEMFKELTPFEINTQIGVMMGDCALRDGDLAKGEPPIVAAFQDNMVGDLGKATATGDYAGETEAAERAAQEAALARQKAAEDGLKPPEFSDDELEDDDG